jgi:hypothetical protein
VKRKRTKDEGFGGKALKYTNIGRGAWRGGVREVESTIISSVGTNGLTNNVAGYLG